MAVKNLCFALLLTFFTTVYAAPTVKTSGCTNPLVRREWRALTDGERKEWIDAVKVGFVGSKQLALVVDLAV